MEKLKVKKVVSVKAVVGAYACSGKCFNSIKASSKKSIPSTKSFN